MNNLEKKVWGELHDDNLYEPTKDTPVFEVNTLNENGEIEFSNTCNTLISAIEEYNNLGSIDKEILKHSLDNNGEDRFDEIASYYVADDSGIKYIKYEEETE